MTNQPSITFQRVVDAIQKNENALQVVQEFIRDPSKDVNQGDKNGVTLLHYAAEVGNKDVVSCLLLNGAQSFGVGVDVVIGGTQAIQGYTPLHLAAKNGHRDIVQYLLNAGANSQSRTRWRGMLRGDTPAEVAKTDEIEELIDSSSNYTTERIYHYLKDIRADQSNTILSLIQNGTNLTRRIGSNQSTLLHIAISYEASEEVVKALADSGVLINMQDGTMNTPLHIAVETSSPEILQHLIQRGAKVDVKNIQGETPLLKLLRSDRFSAQNVDCLLLNGADPKIADSRGETALHCAVFRDHTEVIDSLIKHGADVNAQTESGYTPLHNAVFQKNPKATFLLLRAGADITLVDQNEKTALRHIREINAQGPGRTVNGVCVEYMLGAREQTDKMDEVAYLSLRQAVTKNQPSVVKALATIFQEGDVKLSSENKLELIQLAGSNDLLRESLLALPVVTPERPAQEETIRAEDVAMALPDAPVTDSAIEMTAPQQLEPIQLPVDPISLGEEEGQTMVTPVDVSVPEVDLTTVLQGAGVRAPISPAVNSPTQTITTPQDQQPVAGQTPSQPEALAPVAPQRPSQQEGVVPVTKAPTPPQESPQDVAPTPQSAEENQTAIEEEKAGQEASVIQVIRHRYGATDQEHQDVLAQAQRRNRSRLDYRRRGRRNRSKPTPYQTAINNIQKMEALGLLPKGPNGESNAEVYLYRLYQAQQFYHPDEMLMTESGEYRRVRDLFRSNDGKSLNRVYRNLIARELSEDQLRAYAPTLLTAERCIDEKGHDRTRHSNSVRGRSFRPGRSHNIEEISESVTKTLEANAESVPEYTHSDIDQSKRVAVLGNNQNIG